MSNIFSERCPKCGEVINFTVEATRLNCLCGYEFLVVEFASKRLQLEQAEADKQTAKEQLVLAEKQKDALQARLNSTLTALEHIEGTQKAEDAKLKGILDKMKDDRQAQDAMADLLRTVRAEQSTGQDTLSELLRAVMKNQTGADAKLDAMQDLAARILEIQQANGAAQEQLQAVVLQKIAQLGLTLGEQLNLSNSFYTWSRAMQAEDVQRLKKLQSSSDVLLQGQRNMSAKLNSLEKSIEDTKAAVDKGFDRQDRQRLDKMMELYHQATGFQIDRNFDAAKEKYLELLAEGKEAKCAEVYWRMLLCHYGVEYQEDQGKLIPIILRPDLFEYGTKTLRKDLQDHITTQEQKEYYSSRLEKIDFYLQRYQALRTDKSWQYDVFISVKQSDHDKYTTDSDRASELYFYFDKKPELAAKKLKVFNSRHTPLPKGKEYEPYIMTALMSSKLLILVGSRADYLDSKWVRSEWTRFKYLQARDIQATGKSDRRLFCYFVGGMRPNQLPAGLNPDVQGVMGGVSAGDEILEVVEEMFPTAKMEPTPVVTPPIPDAETPEKIVSRMETWLKLGQFQKVSAKYEELLDERPELLTEAPWICLHTLCAQNKCRTLEKLATVNTGIQDDRLYELAYEYADDKLKARLDSLFKVRQATQEPQGKQAKPEPPGKQVQKEPARQEIPVSKPVTASTPATVSKPATAADTSPVHVVLTKCPLNQKLRVIKEVRELFKLGLKEAKDLVENCPIRLASDISREEAERIRKPLVAVGAEVLIQPANEPQSTVSQPTAASTAGPMQVTMISCPQNAKLLIIKEVRELFKLGLKEAKDLVESCPCCLATKISSDEARRIQQALINAGAEAVIHPAGASISSLTATPPPAASADNKQKLVTSEYTYEGEVLNGKRHGYGVSMQTSGDRYEGNFANGLRNGHGVYVFADGNRYDGDWKDNKRTGKGTFTWANGEKYVGDFVNDKMHGRGVYFFISGNKYDGDWNENKRTGKGTFTWPNGDKYVGDFLNGKMHGCGVYNYTNGNRYDGDWKEDNRTGKGTFTWANGDRYVGDFLNDQRTGKGVYYFSNGDKYEGGFTNGAMTGAGTYTRANGQVLPYLNGKEQPNATPLDTFAKYSVALEAEVKQRSRELTVAEIDDFIRKYNLGVKQIGRTEVQKDLKDVYAKLGIKPSGNIPLKQEASSKNAGGLRNHKAYLDALENFVQRIGKRLDADQTDSFFKFYRLQEQNLTKSMVQQDLETVYVKLGIKPSASVTAKPKQNGSTSTPLDTFAKYCAALESEVKQRSRELTVAEIDDFIRKYNLGVKQIGRTEVLKDLKDVYAKLGIKPSASVTANPKQNGSTSTPLDTFAKYCAALESEAKQRSRELTVAEIDDFIRKYNLGVKQIGRTEVQKDLKDVYAKLGYSAKGTTQAKPTFTSAPPADNRKLLTDTAAADFWRSWLPKVNGGAVLKPQISSDVFNKAMGVFGMMRHVDDTSALGVIYINHGLFQGNTVVVVTRERLYINSNDKKRYPATVVPLRSVKRAEAVPASNTRPMYRLDLEMKNGDVESFGSPPSNQYDTLNYRILAEAINEFIRTFKL